MCDTALPTLAELTDIDDRRLVEAIGGWARAEAAASARRLAAVAELVRRRTAAAHEQWSCDDWDAAAAEVAAALNLSHGKASGQMHLAAALRTRLPRVAALFADGSLSAPLIAAIAWHTQLITDGETLRLVDKALARDAWRYGPLSANKTAQAINAIVDAHDPGALRQSRALARGREVMFDTAATRQGLTPMWGYLYAQDAAALDRRLIAMAHQVCDEDPRTLAQRRADAMGVLGAGGDRLVCGCGRPDCPCADAPDQPSAVLVHVVADDTAVNTPADPQVNGETPTTAAPTAPKPASTRPALLLGGTVMPTPLLAEMIRAGAKVRPLRIPDPKTPPEPHYRPSTALADFVRCRDMTCRFPGCDAPAEFCDIDHTIPYGDGGATHASNLKCLCRKHHLLKTFWAGWRDRQYPDGTVEWTTPSGATYTTHPGSRLLFPSLCASTGELPPPVPSPRPDSCRTLAMPLRKRTRAQNRAQAIKAERRLNDAHIAARNEPPPF